MEKLKLLEHPEFGKVRVEKRGAEFLFCAKDVCDALGLENVSKAVSGLDDDEKGVGKVYTPGGPQEMLFVTESGLSGLIIRSNKPVARMFRKWITGEVLPSLRKYGMYSTDARVMDRLKKRAEAKAVRSLLEGIDGELSDTDRRMVARQCRTDVYEVWDVLSRRKEDASMLTLLYGRAMGNRTLRESFYTQTGAEKLLRELENSR
jgi:prophage antirepressor-like protein